MFSCGELKVEEEEEEEALLRKGWNKQQTEKMTSLSEETSAEERPHDWNLPTNERDRQCLQNNKRPLGS